jgi:hypothetical protein
MAESDNGSHAKQLARSHLCPSSSAAPPDAKPGVWEQRNHLAHVYAKIGVGSQQGLINLLRQNGTGSDDHGTRDGSAPSKAYPSRTLNNRVGDGR